MKTQFTSVNFSPTPPHLNEATITLIWGVFSEIETVSFRLLVSISPYVKVSSERKITKSLLTHRIVNKPYLLLLKYPTNQYANRHHWTKTMIFSDGASRSQLCTCCFKVWSFVASGIGILFLSHISNQGDSSISGMTPMKSRSFWRT